MIKLCKMRIEDEESRVVRGRGTLEGVFLTSACVT